MRAISLSPGRMDCIKTDSATCGRREAVGFRRLAFAFLPMLEEANFSASVTAELGFFRPKRTLRP
jgi:hypothetical protein